MSKTSISGAHLDYIQRTSVQLAKLPTAFDKPQFLRRLLHIKEVKLSKRQERFSPKEDAKDLHLPSEILLTGLYGNRVPIAFLVVSQRGAIKVNIGTWGTTSGNVNIDQKESILKSALCSLYSGIETEPVEVSLPSLGSSGLALGIPTPLYPPTTEDPMAIDRIIRAIPDGQWSFLILAQPLHESTVRDYRQDLIEEMRVTQNASEAGQAAPSLIEQYNNLLKISLETLNSGATTGAWRTAVYLLGDQFSFNRLASLWRGLFAGERSLPESISIWPSEQVRYLADKWLMPEGQGSEPPGNYRRPTEFQTILNSRQLAAYIHLPQLETLGFKVSTLPDFDIMPPRTIDNDNISLGQVILRTMEVDEPYLISRDDLSRHAFVSGVTGQGKTNTIFNLLVQAGAKGISFLVIEPAKKEYRRLLSHPKLRENLQIFTLGDEQVAPFRLNPFEVVPKSSIAVHLDLLRSVFTASFGMWTPLPQILERCLYEVYEDKGWDIANNINARLEDEAFATAAFPTLTDLAEKVGEVTNQLGYDARVKADLRAALLTRINSLRTGAKGLMLDVIKSVPMDALMKSPTVIELEGIADDDDKAFLMGLLLIRLVTFRKSCDQEKTLQHLLVIEEAHRLLSNVTTSGRAEDANPKAKAVETFSNLLSEIRAYGQGVIVSDQVPVKLAPDVIKNTNLKIMHRVVAADDRAVLAGSTAMDERQSTALSVLTRGQAAIFSEGDDKPVLVKVPEVKSNETISDEQVRDYMKRKFAANSLLMPTSANCSPFCLGNAKLCGLAREIVSNSGFQNTFARIVLSMTHHESFLERMWPELEYYVKRNLSRSINEQALTESVLTHASWWLANKRGTQDQWAYGETETFAKALKDALIAQLHGNDLNRETFQQVALSQHVRVIDPFPACSIICQQDPPLCLYRSAVVDLIATDKFTDAWQKADHYENAIGSAHKESTWEVCMMASHSLMEFADNSWNEKQKFENFAAGRRAGLCFGMHMLAQDSLLTPNRVQSIMQELISESNQKD